MSHFNTFIYVVIYFTADFSPIVLYQVNKCLFPYCLSPHVFYLHIVRGCGKVKHFKCLPKFQPFFVFNKKISRYDIQYCLDLKQFLFSELNKSVQIQKN